MKKQIMAKCPKCKKIKDMTYPALSRRDEYQYICSQCGTDEAMEDFEKFRLQKYN